MSENSSDINNPSPDRKENRRLFTVLGIACTAAAGLGELLDFITGKINPSYNPGNLTGGFLLSIAYYLLVLAAASAAVRFFARGGDQAPVEPVQSRPGIVIIASLPVCASLVFIASMLIALSGGYADGSGSSSGFLKTPLEGVVYFAASVIVVPVAEEYFFRKTLTGAVAGRSGVMAVVLSALMFGLCRSDWRQAVTSFALGLVLGAAYLISGKFYVPVIIHAVFNLVFVFWPVLASSLLTDAESLERLLEAVNEFYSSSTYDAALFDEIVAALPEHLPYLLTSSLLSAVTDGLVLAGPLAIFLCRRKIKIPKGSRPIAREEIGDTVFLAPGMLLFFATAVILIAISAFA